MGMSFLLFLVIFISPWGLEPVLAEALQEPRRTFHIDYQADTFRMDGQPFRYVSGSLHYFRVPRPLWQDRLKKIRAGGFNAIQFVIPWNLHEPQPGSYVFQDMLDINAFLTMAAEEDLYVLLRPGPYICAEHNGGGLPFWLYQMYPNITLRSSDPNYMEYVDKWWAVLLPLIRPQLYINGGNIIMVQLENEYGSYGLQTSYCDVRYMKHLHDLVRQHLGPEVVMYTTDGAGDGYLRCGSIEDAYTTVDFGPGANITKAFNVQRHFQPHGPLVNSEFYPGWLDYWGHPHNVVGSNASAKALDAILATGANINIYMLHGGTSFGFDNGANLIPGLAVEPTSYDYDAPISEAGDLTEKYFAIKNVIAKYLPLPEHLRDVDMDPISQKGDYGRVSMKFVSSFFVANGTILKKVGENCTPLTFEQVGQENGFMLYETGIDKLFTDPAKLEITEIHDRAYIFVNKEPRGVLSRAENVKSMPLFVDVGDTLQILVENQGRIGYGPHPLDFKGIVSKVTLEDSAESLDNWTMYSMPLNDTKILTKYVKTVLEVQKNNSDMAKLIKQDFDTTRGKGSFWQGEFTVPCSAQSSLDTFIKFPNGWRKGVAFVNGKNIGKYWPRNGPQMTLYVPGVWLKKPCKVNEIILFEQENPGCLKNDCYIELVKDHVINGPTPTTKRSNKLFKRMPISSPSTN